MENVLHAPAQRRGGNRTATLATCVLAAFALLAVVAAGIALYGQATVTDFTAKNLAPSLEHPFGTDWMGRDMLARPRWPAFPPACWWACWRLPCRR